MSLGQQENINTYRVIMWQTRAQPLTFAMHTLRCISKNEVGISHTARGEIRYFGGSEDGMPRFLLNPELSEAHQVSSR